LVGEINISGCKAMKPQKPKHAIQLYHPDHPIVSNYEYIYFITGATKTRDEWFGLVSVVF
jgi:hypothetical protein